MCAGEDLLNECNEWCNKLNVRRVTMETDPKPAEARSEDLKLKKRIELNKKKRV